MPGVRSWFRLVWVFELRAASCRVCPPRSQIACSGKRSVARAATGWAPCQWLLISATRVSATLTSCPRRAWQTQKVSLSKIVSVLAVSLVFHRWSYIFLKCRLRLRLTFVINDQGKAIISCHAMYLPKLPRYLVYCKVQQSCCVQICHNILERPNF